MRNLFLAILTTSAAMLPVRAPAQDVPPSAIVKSAADYVVAHYQTPEDYVVGKFKDHDVVYLGESHLVKQELQFLRRLIPQLYKAGVYDLCYEMGLTAQQAEIDALIQASTFDNTKALTLLFQWDAQIGWAFQEYADVYRAAWEVNHRLPKGAHRFRIVGIDYRPDWSLVKDGDKVGSRQMRWRAWAGSNQITRNVTMADLIMREFVAKKHKVLVYGGYGHTYLIPTLDKLEESGMRFSAAYLIRRQIGERITSIKIVTGRTDFPHDRLKMPAIDAVFAEVPAKYRAAGFDLKGSPLGELPLPEALATKLVTDHKPVTIADEIAGIAHLNEEGEVATFVQGFITESLVAQSKRDGWLPNVPSVTLDWILANSKYFQKLVSNPPPSGAK